MSSEHALVRLNYFQGQLLSVDDLQAEQEYFLARMRRHNRHLHGWGVVSGLRVSLVTSTDIEVRVGYAIDCAGNEIHLDAPIRLPIPAGARPQYVVIGYGESKTAPIPVLPNASPSDSEQVAFTRIQEESRVAIVNVDPTSGHARNGIGTPGCGVDHALCIATLVKRGKGWRLAQRGRRRRI
jgi:hypothetical protein